MVCCWSVSVLAALFVGQALQQPTDYNFTPEATNNVPDVEITAIQSEKPVEQKAANEKPVSIAAPELKSQKNITRPASLHSVMSDLSSYFDKSNYNNFDNYQNMADTWQKIKSMDEEDLYEIYSQLESENEKGVDWNIARILYARMGELDPGRAIAFAVSKKQGYAVNGVISSWSKDKPLEAMEWVLNNKDSFTSSNHVDYTSLFTNLAKVDAEKALDSLSDFSAGKQRNALKGILRTFETNEDFLKAISHYENFEDKNQKISSTLYYWGQKSPKDALAYAQNIESADLRRAAEQKVESAWIRSNPEEAASWILENKENQSHAVSTIINNWNWNQGDKLYDWVQKRTDPKLKDDANYNLIRRYSYNNTDMAKKALENIESEDLRKKAVTQLYKSLKYRDQKAASEFLNGRDEVSEVEKEKLISSRSYRHK